MSDEAWVAVAGLVAVAFFALIGIAYGNVTSRLSKVEVMRKEEDDKIHVRIDNLSDVSVRKDDLAERFRTLESQHKVLDTRTQSMAVTIARIAERMNIPPEKPEG